MLSEWARPLTFTCAGEVVWTPREDQRLMNSYTKIPKEKLVDLFPGRTRGAIQRRASTLRIPRSGAQYTSEEDELLETLYYDTDLTYRQMTRFFKFRTFQSLNKRMARIRKSPQPTDRTLEEVVVEAFLSKPTKRETRVEDTKE